MSVRTTVGGRYVLERVLGRGGMATVYRATDARLERPVAVKVLAEHLADDEVFKRRLVREARLAGALSHPGVVRVYDVGEDGGRPFLVMEYVDGDTLAALLRARGPLPAHEAVDVGLQICAGLEAAHAIGLVHRDLKPQNLLATRSGHVKITDFGIARVDGTTRVTETGTVLGTAGYLAPEQATGGEITRAADIYSLGAVLYELLSGQRPYVFESLPELLAKQRGGRVRPLTELVPAVSPALDRAVRRCLATDPRLRPASARELARELVDCSTGEQLAPTVALPPARRAHAARIGGRAVAAAAAIAVAVSAVVLALASSNGDGSLPASTVASIPRSSDAGEQARALSAWLRELGGVPSP